MFRSTLTAFTALLAILVAAPGFGSSHREAPFVAEHPKVDGTDFYMFRSYEPGRDGFVTLIANYQPLQDAYGGPNYFAMDPDARYEIHIDNSGDGKPDITFRFEFDNVLQDLKLPVGDQSVSVPLLNIGAQPNLGSLNVIENYTVTKVGEGRLSNVATGSTTLVKPTDYIGRKSFSDYPAYANAQIFDVNIPGCGNGRVFAGQRKESFAVNLGKVFDLINLNGIGKGYALDRAAAHLNEQGVSDYLWHGGGSSVLARLPVQDGVATSEAILLDTGTVTVGGEGSANLRDETLDFRVTPQAKQASLLSLAVPFRITGPLRQPQVGPDPLGTAVGVAKVAGIFLNPLVAGATLLLDTQTAERNPCVAALDGGQGAAQPQGTILDKATTGVTDTLKGVGEGVGKGLKNLFGD